MQTRHWFKLLVATVAAAGTGVAAWAQGPYATPGNPAPAPSGPVYGAMSPQYSGYEQAGYPPGANPWPQVSPFEGPLGWQQQKLRNEGGNWFQSYLLQNRKYYFSANALLGQYSNPEPSLIGSSNVVFHPFFVGTTTTTTTTTSGFGQQFGSAQGQLPGSGSPVPEQSFPWHNLGELKSNLTAGGAKIAGGFFNADGTGMRVSATWLARGSSDLFVGNPNLNVNNLATYYVGSGIPLVNAATIAVAQQGGSGAAPVGFQGNWTEQRYDLYYKLDYRAEAYGGDLSWYFGSLYDGDNFKLRPIIGAKIFQVNEQFVLNAADSGRSYTLGATTGTGTGTTGSSPNPRVPTNDGTTTTTSALNILQTNLSSMTRGFFVGPEFGLRFDLGNDDGFKIWTESKFGLLAGTSKRQLNSTNLGIQTQFITTGTTTTTTTNTPVFPAPGSVFATTGPGTTLEPYHETRSTNYVTPAFEQSITMRAPLLSYVPIIKKLKAFEKAQFQAGYTFTALTDIYRPGDNVNYRSLPELPSLLNERSLFWISAFNLGVEWTY